MFQLTYTLCNHGWADVTIGDGQHVSHISASFLSDALGDLARAARGLLRALPDVSFVLMEEPAEYRFVVTRHEDDRLQIVVNRSATGAAADRRVIVSATTDLRSFTNAVINVLRHVLDEHGEAEYLRRWKNHPFPRQEFEDLLALRRNSDQTIAMKKCVAENALEAGTAKARLAQRRGAAEASESDP